MRKTISEFFHYLGVLLSVLAFIVFFLGVHTDSPDSIWIDVLFSLTGGVLIYGFARFIGWVVNSLKKE